VFTGCAHLAYFEGGAFPLPPPDGLPVVLGQLPPCPPPWLPPWLPLAWPPLLPLLPLLPSPPPPLPLPPPLPWPITVSFRPD